MPTTNVSTYSGNELRPYDGYGNGAKTDSGRLLPSTVFPKGCLLGEVTASPGVFAPYASGASDGTQNGKRLLLFACATDASGNITIGGAATGGPHGETYLTAPMYTAGDFMTADLPQSSTGAIDATAVNMASAQRIGRLILGTTAAGLLRLGV